MLFDPLLGFYLGLKFTEEVRGFVWPRDFDAPIVQPVTSCARFVSYSARPAVAIRQR